MQARHSYSHSAANTIKVGGSAGHDAFQLAKVSPDLTLVVQDLDECKPVFEASLPVELKDCVLFVVHNFFNPQPVSADIYLLKMILHDWPDYSAGTDHPGAASGAEARRQGYPVRVYRLPRRARQKDTSLHYAANGYGDRRETDGAV